MIQNATATTQPQARIDSPIDGARARLGDAVDRFESARRPASWAASIAGAPGGASGPGSGDPAAERAQQAFGDQFRAKAGNAEEFHSLMRQSFGEGYDRASAENLRQRTLAGDTSWLPKARFVSDAALGGADGAYSAETGLIYLNEKLRSNPNAAAQVYTEEAGHHLDTLLNASDAAGDEGAIFRRLMGGESLSTKELSTLRSENDHGTITVDGVEIAVEFKDGGGGAGGADGGADGGGDGGGGGGGGGADGAGGAGAGGAGGVGGESDSDNDSSDSESDASASDSAAGTGSAASADASASASDTSSAADTSSSAASSTNETDESEDSSVASAVGNAVSAAAAAVGAAASAVGSAIGSAASAVGSAIGNAASAVGSAVSTAANAIGKAARSAAQTVGQIANNVVSSVRTGINALAHSKLGQRIGNIASKLKDGLISDVKGFASKMSRAASQLARGQIAAAAKSALDAIADITNTPNRVEDSAIETAQAIVGQVLGQRAADLFGKAAELGLTGLSIASGIKGITSLKSVRDVVAAGIGVKSVVDEVSK